MAIHANRAFTRDLEYLGIEHELYATGHACIKIEQCEKNHLL